MYFLAWCHSHSHGEQNAHINTLIVVNKPHLRQWPQPLEGDSNHVRCMVFVHSLVGFGVVVSIAQARSIPWMAQLCALVKLNEFLVFPKVICVSILSRIASKMHHSRIETKIIQKNWLVVGEVLSR